MKINTIIFLLFCAFAAKAITITGTVTDEKKLPIPLATVFVKGTTIGTTTNTDGVYFIEIPTMQTVDLVIQCIGYKAHTETLTGDKTTVVFNIQLQPEEQILSEITVKANSEDPAYRMIRQTIKNKKALRAKINSFSCDVYIKGNQHIKEAPKKILGREVGDYGGGLDSTGSGIVYLSESVSKLNFEQPDHYKEIMISSKVAGNSSGFSFNQAQAINLDFYKNELELQSKLVSPLADDALSYYKYKLISSFRNSENLLISKIQVLPKNEYGPVFGGFIYIVEDKWVLFGTELYVTKNASGIEVLDTLHIKQTHLPQGENWLLFEQNLSFRIKVLDINTSGLFTAVFRNYILNPPFSKDFFTAEILTVSDSANTKSKAYWDSIRPIPLTLEEQMDYTKKDSLQIIRTSKRYLDSMDVRRNKFTLLSALVGYTIRNSYKKEAWRINSPLLALQYNTVQGANADLGVSFRKGYDNYRIRWWEAAATVNYGFEERKPRIYLDGTYHFNRLTNAELEVSGGSSVVQFNNKNPISPTINTSYSLFEQQNLMKLYEKTEISARYEQEMWTGGVLSGELEYAERNSLQNNSSLSWYSGKDSRFYTENNNFTQKNDYFLRKNTALQAHLRLQVKFNQSYIMYPERKITLDDVHYPVLTFGYDGGLVGTDFQKFTLKTEYALGLGVFGTTNVNVTGGYFLKNATYFYDFQHFNGNQTILGNPNAYLSSFKMLPYYDNSIGTGSFAEAHAEHDFGKFIFNKIPLFKKLGLTTHAGANYLYTSEKTPQNGYMEYNIGIGNIGWGVFRLLRVDYIWARQPNGTQQNGLMIGVNLGE
jgi:hypothetical protein